jgi:hypothetical protein
MHHSALLNSGMGLCSFVGFPWFNDIKSSADVTMETKACALL